MQVVSFGQSAIFREGGRFLVSFRSNKPGVGYQFVKQILILFCILMMSYPLAKDHLSS